MRFALMTEPQQGISYEEILAIASTAEEAGFEAYFRSDHFASFPGEAGLPTTDCWATLAGLARETRSIRLGALVSPVTFRIPGAFAKLVTTVDEMSGGRIECGVGAGWNDLEHAQLGLPFPDVKERVDMLEEELIILRGLWDEPDGWSHAGAHWQVSESRYAPRDHRPNLIVGGTGKPRSLRLAARYADEYNVSGSTPEEAGRIYERLAEACRAVGRDPDAITRSVMGGVIVADDQAGLDERIHDLVTTVGADQETEAWLAARRPRWVVGTPEQARSRIEEFAAAGAQRIMLQDFLPRDLDHVRFMGERLLD